MSVILKLERKFRRAWWNAKAAYLRRVHRYVHTGERVCPDIPDENFENHRRVYEFAAQFVAGKRVLDVGCGTGYGSALFAERGAAAVTGIDLSPEAVGYARRKFHDSGVMYQVMDAEALTVPPGSFDVAFSSENLEHLPHPERCLQGIRRALAPGGLLVLGTPNPEMGAGEINPYHVRELPYEELHALLRGMFEHVVIFENSLESPAEEGRAARRGREQRGAVGVPPGTTPIDVEGRRVLREHLHNTHSFMVLAW